MSAVVLCWHWLLFCQSKAASSLWFQAPLPEWVSLSSSSQAQKWPNSSHRNNILPDRNKRGLRCLHIFHHCWNYRQLCLHWHPGPCASSVCLIHYDQKVTKCWCSSHKVFIGRKVPYIRWKQCQYMRKHVGFIKINLVFLMWKCFVKKCCITIFKSSSFRDGLAI